MSMRSAFLFWFLLFMAAPVSAGELTSFQELWDAVAHDPDCKPSQFPDFVLFTCERQYTFWYLTKPNHPAHPGIIKRYLYQQDGAWNAKEEGRSFASDAAQPAFKAWLAQIADMDRQAREWIKKQHSQEPDSKR
jgi:hypothetical protein